MQVLEIIQDISHLTDGCVLTIGVFDGIHLGHQTLIKKMHKYSGLRVLLTFSNHPSTVLSPSRPTPLIIPVEQRIEFLKTLDLDIVFLLPFNRELASMSYKAFFKKLQKNLNIKHLIVGADAVFGNNREGTQKHIEALNLFQTTYLKKRGKKTQTISSENIRDALKNGNLKHAAKLLGRRYSLRLPFDNKNCVKTEEKKWRWSTKITGLCALPSGSYHCLIQMGQHEVPGSVSYSYETNFLQEVEQYLTIEWTKPIIFKKWVHITIISRIQDPKNPQLILRKLLNIISAKPSLS